MAETVENGIVDMAEPSSDIPAAKQQIQQDEGKKQNGISNHKSELSNDSSASQDGADQEQRETDDAAVGRVNGSKESTDMPAEQEQVEDNKPDESPVQDEEKTTDDDQAKPSEDDKNETISMDQTNSDSVDENPEIAEDTNSSSEPMEVDTDSKIADESSNVSAANSDVIAVNSSNNPSIESEDSSRDSVDTIESKSDDMDEPETDQGLVSKVKDDDGGDILITLNEDDVEKDTDEASKDGSSAEKEIVSEDSNSNQEKSKPESRQKNQDKQKNGNVPKPVTQKPPVSLLTNMQQPGTGMGPTANVPTIQNFTSGGQTFLIQGGASIPSIPVGAQLVQQGSQLGYLTRIGVQNIFVPVTNLSASVPTAQVATTQSQPQSQAHSSQPQQSAAAAIDPEALKPKSSLDMIELMKWEIQNRIPDNSNWSVAFHPKKEELSAITSFLLELGHDVVKESVYKDIIQIQTKKKDAGELKANEVESLDKMKTVYENTRKKVEHLQLKNKKCDGCEFKTESRTVMNWHKDFPHFDPPWDTSHGWMNCAYCDYRTKAAAQFSFHMSAMHNSEAKLPDKISCFQCELCPLNTTTKNKLDKHRQKCIKHFKLNVNLHPYYHDVNFCMKTCYYKPKRAPKPVPKPPAPVKSVPSQPSTHTMSTRPAPSPSVRQPQKPVNPRPTTVSQMMPKPPPLQQMQAIPPKIQAQKPASFSHPRPSIATARNSVPPAPRPQAPIQRAVRPQGGKEMAGFEVCELCGGYVKDRHALRIHFYYAHKVEMPQAIFNRPERPLSCEVCKSKFWTTQGLTKHKSTLRHYNSPSAQQNNSSTPGTNQQCFMCMRKVANLFIHIENVHGMTMKDLIAMKKCIICGITAADRKNLEMHMASAHGVLIKANDFVSQEKQTKPLTPVQSNSPKPTKPATSMVTGVPVGKNTKPSIKQNLCVFCQLQFADNIQLTMHCIKNHATCNECGMVVQSNKHLNNHNCRMVKRHCDICGMRNIASDVYVEHVKKLHMKPCKVEVSKMSETEIDEVKDKIKREYKPQVISLDSEEDSDVELVESDSGEKTEKKSRSKENKENIEKPVDLSDISEAEGQETSKSRDIVDESSNDSKNIKREENDELVDEKSVEPAETDPPADLKESSIKQEPNDSKQGDNECSETDDVKDSSVKQESNDSEQGDNECSEMADVDDSSIKQESNESGPGDIEYRESSRKRKADEDCEDDDTSNKKVKVESDNEEHSKDDTTGASGDGVSEMEKDSEVKGEPDTLKDSVEDTQSDLA